MPSIREKIAAGYNEQASVEALPELNPPLFYRYKFAILSEWYESEGRRPTSLDYPKLIGAPHFVWVFGVLSQAELLWWRTNITREVTAFAYNKDLSAWKYYNAEQYVERLLPENWRQGMWVNVRVHFIHPVEVAAPP